MIDRFMNLVSPEPNSGCWLWAGSSNWAGYGKFGIGHGKAFSAHRVSWELHRGEIPEGLFVLHRCDVTGCVNPDHLYLGTQSDNITDAYRRGRKKPGDGRNQWSSRPWVKKRNRK